MTVRGGATAEELGVIVALLTRAGSGVARPEGYERWRRDRLRALRSELAEPRVRTPR